VRYPDAHELTADDARVIGAFVYRGAIGGEEVWDHKNQQWVVPPIGLDALATLKPLPFGPAPGEPAPWKATLVAAGQKDKGGNPRYAKSITGTPVYRLRAFARAKRDGVEFQGLGAPTPDIQFVSATENQRFVVGFDTDDVSTARRARVMLKNSALQPAGFLEIRATGGQEVEVANCEPSGNVRARITLTSTGDIRLTPAPGRRILLDGDLDAQHITYQPQGGGTRQTL
jgi:hypothetical protein